MEELKASLKKSGLFTVIVNGIMLLLSVFVMIMGFVICQSAFHHGNNIYVTIINQEQLE